MIVCWKAADNVMISPKKYQDLGFQSYPAITKGNI
jgi:hypothetical protein